MIQLQNSLLSRTNLAKFKLILCKNVYRLRQNSLFADFSTHSATVMLST